jgi:hypothetical protein
MSEIYEFTSKLNSAILKNANDADPQQIGEEIDRLRIEHGGSLSTDEMVKAVKKLGAKKSPSHRHFDWDDKSAAHEHRRTQAAELMRSVNIIYESPGGESKKVRAFSSVRDEENPKKHVYITTETAMGDTDMREYVLNQSLNGLQQWRDRWASLKEYADALEFVDKALEVMNKRKK